MRDVGQLQPLLKPRSVAVIGASSNEEKAGSILLSNIVDGGFTGRIYPVNPRGGTLGGKEVFPSIKLVPEAVDVAFIAVGRELVRTAVEECGQAGVQSLVIITAGFAEADAWGDHEQREIAGLIQQYDMCAIGPNTIGLVTMGGLHRGSFVKFPSWEDGPVALVAQSGVFAGAIADEEMARRAQRLGMNATVGIGNRIDLTECDFLNAFASDDAIEVIGVYLESFADVEDFLAIAAKVKQEKPVVLLKGGRTEPGKRAALSHTGALMADDSVLDQLLVQHGVLRAADEEEFVSLLKGFSRGPIPRGRRLGIVTFSGAFGVLAADLLKDNGLELARFTDQSIAVFQSLLPPWQEARNPADLWAAVDIHGPREGLVRGLETALADPDVDQVLGILLAVPNADFDGLDRAIAGLLQGADKPLHLIIRGSLQDEWSARMDGSPAIISTSVRQAMKVIGGMAQYAATRHVMPSYLQPLDDA